jgi:hypothetical protein
MNKLSVIFILLLAPLIVACSSCVAPEERASSFEYLSLSSSRYVEASSVVRSPAPEFPKSISTQAIKEELGLSSELRLEYFETRDLGGGRSVDIYEVYGMPDTFIGVSEGSSDILIITL